MDTISREPTTVAVMLVEEFMNPISLYLLKGLDFLLSGLGRSVKELIG
ncbi:Uncharacterised protein [Yersinia frederiksenii]|nr:Uncharacterised protein [Yersinia frederiksenii]